MTRTETPQPPHPATPPAPQDGPHPAPPALARFAWAVLAFTVLVILWGAVVRATGSGAGCGTDWPTCNGRLIPESSQVATWIEFTHRLTSGASLLLVLALFGWARRRLPAGHRARRAARWAVVFIVVEALIGAGLVLFEMVAENASAARGVWVSLHLVNTFLLLAALALTAWWAGGRPAPRRRGRGDTAAVVALGAAGLLALGVSGAIAALGDTLFKAASLREGLAADFAPAAHLFVRLRVWHPLLAVFVAGYVVLATAWLPRRRADATTSRLALWAFGLVVLQLLVGLANLFLLAPLALQVVHLLLADGIWIAWVLLGAAALAGSDEHGGQVEQVQVERLAP